MRARGTLARLCARPPSACVALALLVWACLADAVHGASSQSLTVNFVQTGLLSKGQSQAYEMRVFDVDNWFMVAAHANVDVGNTQVSLYVSTVDMGADFLTQAQSKASGQGVSLGGALPSTVSKVYIVVTAQFVDGTADDALIEYYVIGSSGVGVQPGNGGMIDLVVADGVTASGAATAVVARVLAASPAANVARYEISHGSLANTDSPFAQTILLANVDGMTAAIGAARYARTTVLASSCPAQGACQVSVTLSLPTDVPHVFFIVAYDSGDTPVGYSTRMSYICSGLWDHLGCRKAVTPPAPSPSDPNKTTFARFWIYLLVVVVVVFVSTIGFIITRRLYRNRRRQTSSRWVRNSAHPRSRASARAAAAGRASGAAATAGADGGGAPMYDAPRHFKASFNSAPAWLWIRTSNDRQRYAIGDDSERAASLMLPDTPEEADGDLAEDRRRRRAAAAAEQQNEEAPSSGRSSGRGSDSDSSPSLSASRSSSS